jgi:hypothetical protein
LLLIKPTTENTFISKLNAQVIGFKMAQTAAGGWSQSAKNLRLIEPVEIDYQLTWIMIIGDIMKTDTHTKIFSSIIINQQSFVQRSLHTDSTAFAQLSIWGFMYK